LWQKCFLRSPWQNSAKGMNASAHPRIQRLALQIADPFNNHRLCRESSNHWTNRWNDYVKSYADVLTLSPSGLVEIVPHFPRHPHCEQRNEKVPPCSKVSRFLFLHQNVFLLVQLEDCWSFSCLRTLCVVLICFELFRWMWIAKPILCWIVLASSPFSCSKVETSLVSSNERFATCWMLEATCRTSSKCFQQRGQA
jgi:hypothetical protein